MNNKKGPITNKKPQIKDDRDFKDWLDSQYDLVVRSHVKNSDHNVERFISSVFSVLSKANTCFYSGSLVFSDEAGLFFNLLTFNTLMMDDDTYQCKDFKRTGDFSFFNRRQSIITSKNVSSITKITHSNVFKEKKAKDIDCIPSSAFNTKFERIITKIKDLCQNTNHNIKKSVCLFYPFASVKNKNRRMLLLKLEGSQQFSVSHAIRKASMIVGADKVSLDRGIDKKTGLPIRREDSNPSQFNYNELFAEKDKEFYKNYHTIFGIELDKTRISQDLRELEWYNNNLRTGCEVFISKHLGRILLMKLLMTTVTTNLKTMVTDKDITKIPATISSSTGSKSKSKSSGPKSAKSKGSSGGRKTFKRRR